MIVDAAREFQELGYVVIPCDGKKPTGGAGWHTHWKANPQNVITYLESHPDATIGLQLGPDCGSNGLMDIEADSPEEQAAFDELFEGVEIPQTPSFQSTRGRHVFFQSHPRLAHLGGVVKYKGLGIRLGGSGKGAQSIIPPSMGRQWD